MQQYSTVKANILALLTIRAGLLLGALGLLWLVQDTPVGWPGWLRLDGLAAFWLLIAALWWGWGRERAGGRGTLRPYRSGGRGAVGVVGAVGLAIGLTTVIAPLVPLALGVAMWAGGRGDDPRPGGDPRPGDRVGSPLLPAACVLLGYGWLALRGGLLLDARTAGAGLDAAVVLTVAAVALSLIGAAGTNSVAAALWLYPLLRLYTLGPWETWVALVGVCAGALLALAYPQRWLGGAALALACLGTSAGVVAASCAALVLVIQRAEAEDTSPRSNEETKDTKGFWETIADPRSDMFQLPVLWMSCAAALAGGASALAAALLIAAYRAGGWRAALTGALARPWALWPLLLVPPLVSWALRPLVAQLQGGLSSYGTLSAQPWLGVTALDSARATVAALQIVPLAALLLVLVAAVALLRGPLR